MTWKHEASQEHGRRSSESNVLLSRWRSATSNMLDGFTLEDAMRGSFFSSVAMLFQRFDGLGIKSSVIVKL